ncbi:MAG TPA: hypothetical protein PLY87_15135 [Planctomycetaceae bacterium]|nr:hypothetical protein [Planctomycetaceae bacterium]HQZ66422.1 hypothetical protein [Planctomycetaceae bacterium]
MWHRWCNGMWLTTAATCCWMCLTADAGMPAPLPTGWTVESGTNGVQSVAGTALRIQAISFFVAVLLLSGWLVKGLWNLARRDFPRLPLLTYGRALGLVLLWGLSFVIVLTMISGARELMTPGAWRKQGWTYQLADTARTDADSGRAARQRQLEHLRTALWQFAATHDGRLPTIDDSEVDAALWEIPGFPGLKYLAVSGCNAESTGRLFVFEPELEGADRMVLLTNGFIGSMSSSDIKQALSEARKTTESPSSGLAP